MTVTLNRQDVFTLYRHLREADRSLHFLMNPAKGWDEFLAYYQPQKRRIFQQVLDRLQPEPASAPAQPPQPCGVTLWRFWFGRHFARKRQSWKFPFQELAWITQQGRFFLELLNNRGKPEMNELIAQRQRLRDAQVLIEARCYGMDELKKAEATDHFDQLGRPPHTQVA